MKKKLEAVKVKSFVTELQNKEGKVVGGGFYTWTCSGSQLYGCFSGDC